VGGSNKKGPSEHEGGPTGPRTPEGKDNTRFNATTHGIFSGVVVLNGESRPHYESLLNGLHRDFQPKGTLEDILVDKLATILWRHRRLILAECGEFQNQAEILNSDVKKHQQDEAETAASMGPKLRDGLIKSISNPIILDRCLELLAPLGDRIQDDESASQEDCHVLAEIYGLRDEDDGQKTPLDTYAKWLERVETPEDLRHTQGYIMLEHISAEDVFQEIEAEIKRLEHLKISQRPGQLERRRREVLRLSINEGAGLERLVRYETSLERAFDRTLAQLERVQRMRLGQPVAPRLEVGLNH